jgi:tetratricopeptide (TPR) repeat protein
MLRGRYGEALPVLQEATRLYRRDGQPADLFSSLILETGAFIAIGGRTRASELMDEAYAVASARGISPVGYFQLGHLMARIGRINGAREALRVAMVRADTTNDADVWALRLLAASVHLAERNGVAALDSIAKPGAPAALDPYRLAIIADANALAGHHEAALDAARQLAQAWHFGTNAQDEWLRATLRIARLSEASGDSAAARTAYRTYIDRWKDADIFLMELGTAQRAFQRLGGTAIASTISGRD